MRLEFSDGQGKDEGRSKWVEGALKAIILENNNLGTSFFFGW